MGSASRMQRSLRRTPRTRWRSAWRRPRAPPRRSRWPPEISSCATRRAGARRTSTSNWTEPPGVLMQESAADGTEVAFSIQGRTLEFVLTDGQGNWDKPSPTQNYVIDEPGAFVLSKGAVVPEEES